MVLVANRRSRLQEQGVRRARKLWVGFVIPIVVTVAAVGGIISVRSNADERRQGQILLSRVDAAANHQGVLVSGVSGLGVVVQDSTNPSFERDLDQLPASITILKQQIEDDLDRLGELSPPEQELGAVVATSEAFQDVLGRQVMLLQERRFDEAWIFDRQRIQPAFYRLRESVRAADDAYSDLAESANSVANRGTAAILGFTVLVLGYLQFDRARRERDMLMAEQRILKDSEERFRSLVQSSSDVISITGADLAVRYHSPAIEKLLGIDPADGVGKRLDDLLCDNDAALFAELHAQVVGDPGGKHSIECCMVHADGTTRDVEITATNLLEVPNVVGLVFNARDITERKEAERERAGLEKQLAYQAFHDPLTGLANRVLFKDRVDHALARRARTKEEIAVLFLDLDDFKAVNDTLGHEAGDEMLKSVAGRLEECLRDSDTVARLGGDEFAILLEDVDDTEHVYVVADRLIESMERPFDLGRRQVIGSASIGIAYGARRVAGSEELLANADVAMYAAKARGKGCRDTYHTDMRRSLLKRMDLESNLQRAVKNNEFVIHYQPIVEVGDGRVTGLEALIRWMDPERGLIPPGEFIPLAEETGLILPIGRWVLEQACSQARRWHLKFSNYEHLKISVNISVRQFQQPGFIDEVAEVLRTTQLPPSQLVLELTESILVQDSNVAVRKLRELKELGVQLALDDFGTGYSSLNYLRRFPIDVLKIDKSFIDGIANGVEDAALARAIVHIGETLQLRTVAEGIEYEEQAEELRSLGCGEGQGFFFARPLESGAVDALLGDDARDIRPSAPTAATA